MAAETDNIKDARTPSVALMLADFITVSPKIKHGDIVVRN